MAASDRVVRAAVLVLAALGACVQPLSEVGRPCPCTTDFVCCKTTNTCLAPGSACPAEPDSSTEDASSGSDAGSEIESGASTPPQEGSSPDRAPDADERTAPRETGASDGDAGSPEAPPVDAPSDVRDASFDSDAAEGDVR